MYYSYVLHSKKDNGFYVGFTKNLKLRFESDNRRILESTMHGTLKSYLTG